MAIVATFAVRSATCSCGSVALPTTCRSHSERRRQPAHRRSQKRSDRFRAWPRTPPTEPGERIGFVTHYYSHLSVAIIRLESGALRAGDVIHIRGKTISQTVESLEVNHAHVTDVGPNEEFGLKVVEHAREHDVVFKVRS